MSQDMRMTPSRILLIHMDITGISPGRGVVGILLARKL